jgi:putative ABC transport system ATP-binding protein
MILNVENLSKQYKQGEVTIHALKSASLSLEKGKTLAIVGPSGSGKTTLLSLMCGLESPSEGKVVINDQVVSTLNEKELSHFRSKNIGIVFQQFHLMPHLTAEENVALPLEILGDKEAEKKAKEALAQVGLGERYNHLPNELSGGECQRVAIARALVVKPNILFADEPSGNLDTETGENVMKLLFDLVKKNNMTMVLVTHDKNLASKCDQQLEIKSGLIQ